MKNRKIKLASLFARSAIVSIVLLLLFSLTGCNSDFFKLMFDDPLKANSSSIVNDSENISSSNNENDSDIISQDEDSGDETSSTVEKAQYPSAIELMGYTPNQLLQKYGPIVSKSGGYRRNNQNRFAIEEIDLKNLPGYSIFINGPTLAEAMNVPIASLRISSLDIDSEDVSVPITSDLYMGQTKKKVEEIVGDEIGMSTDGSWGPVITVYDSERSDCTSLTSSEIENYATTWDTYENGYDIVCTFTKNNDDGQIFIVEVYNSSAECDDYSKIDNHTASQNTQYIINDNIASYVAQHKSYGVDSYDKDSAEEFGKIDAMYAIGLLRYDGMGTWLVRSESGFLKKYPDLDRSYYKSLLKHFGISSNQSFMMPVKYSIANPGGTIDID